MPFHNPFVGLPVLLAALGTACLAEESSRPTAGSIVPRALETQPPMEMAGPMPYGGPALRDTTIAPTHWHPLYYYRKTTNHGVVAGDGTRLWRYSDGVRYGLPFGLHTNAPRAAGPSYNFPDWTPRRSYYLPYQLHVPSDQQLYGVSVEPYYGQTDVPPAEMTNWQYKRAMCLGR